MADGPEAKREFDGVMLVLGALFAAPTLISLIQHIAQVGLHWYFADFVDFYRALVTPLIDLIQAPIRWLLAAFGIDWTIPRWVKDLHTLSFLGTGFLMRGVSTAYFESGIRTIVVGFAIALLFGFIGYGLVIILFLPFVLTRMTEDKNDERTMHRDRTIRLVVAATIAAVVVFYVGNAVVPMLGQ